jgi:hypothetical protein
MLAGRRRRFAMLQFIVSRTRARGSHAMLRDADPRRVCRSSSRQDARGAELCCHDCCAGSSFIGIDVVARECSVGRT